MFVILGFQRSGTHLLATLLNSHPDLRCYDEVLIRKSRLTPLGRKSILELTDKEGCIVMYSHIFKTTKEQITVIRKSKVIHLYRNDVRKHAVSLLKKAGVEISENQILKAKRRISRVRASVLSHAFENFYSITYEEICSNKNITKYENKELLKFLGVKPMVLTTNLTKGEN